MFNGKAALLDKISFGDDSFFNLKEVIIANGRVQAPSETDLADELASFANARGGVCVLGATDGSRLVTGISLPELDTVQVLAQTVCHDLIEPPLLANIERLMLPAADGSDKAVLRIDVPASLFVHRSPGGYLYRPGSRKRVMTTDFLARLFQQRSQTRLLRFDEQAVAAAPLSTLSPALWQRFLTQRQLQEEPAQVLHKMGMACADGDGTWHPSVAGLLLASEDPREFLPHAFVQAVAYQGESASSQGAGEAYQLDAADIGGPLDRQVAESVAFVRRNMKVAAVKTLGRADYPQYDLVAVFEAVVNAVAHRDYALHGAKIRLRLYADRLVLHVPGALSNTMTVDSLPLRQAARNEAITSLLARCKIPAALDALETPRLTLMDRRGEGVGVIFEASRRASGKTPEYKMVDDTELMLTIWAGKPPGST